MSKAAKLPKILLKRSLSELKIGESAWTTPWAMYVDNDDRCFLRIDYNAEEMMGTDSMLVTRTKNGFTADISKCDHKWGRSPGISNPISVSGDWGCDLFLPVVKLITEKEDE